jgi:hypothetical protein
MTVDPEPVEFEIVRDHGFHKREPTKDPKTGRMVKRIGCEVCKRAKLDPAHLGAPPSLNEGGSGMDRMAYQALKKAWGGVMRAQLEMLDLPRPCESIYVECLVGFDQYRERDQGNLRWMIEKALGDELVDGGWLASDCIFPAARYEFGGLRGEHTPGQSWTRFRLFASLTPPTPAPRNTRQGSLL